MSCGVQNIVNAALEALNHQFFFVFVLVPVWSDCVDDVLRIVKYTSTCDGEPAHRHSIELFEPGLRFIQDGFSSILHEYFCQATVVVQMAVRRINQYIRILFDHITLLDYDLDAVVYSEPNSILIIRQDLLV